MKIQKCRKNHIIFWRCDLDLWPTTLKSLSGQDTITTNVYTKFENNPSSGFWVIALTPLRAAGGGRRAAGGGRRAAGGGRRAAGGFDVKP